MIRYLSQAEKRKTLPLWKEAFPEDSDSFLEYYYKEKTRDNRILAAEDEKSGQPLSMLHRNPYKIQVNKQIWDIDYIVAVATAKEYRHQGLMRSLLVKMMADMYQEGREFCFLMPADPKIYEPFDFTYIYDQPYWKLTKEAEKKLEKETDWNQQRSRRTADWMNGWLEERYQVFVRRSPAYVERLHKELESEKGWIETLEALTPKELDDNHKKGRIKQPVGIRCWWGLEKKEQRMLLAEEAYVEREKQDTPAIMARIIHLEHFLRAISLRDDCEAQKQSLTVRLTVEDRICRENEGAFLWTIKKEGSRLRPWETGMRAEKVLETGIAKLTGYLFGYEKNMYKELPWMKEIQVLNRVFLDEVV